MYYMIEKKKKKKRGDFLKAEIDAEKRTPVRARKILQKRKKRTGPGLADRKEKEVTRPCRETKRGVNVDTREYPKKRQLKGKAGFETKRGATTLPRGEKKKSYSKKRLEIVSLCFRGRRGGGGGEEIDHPLRKEEEEEKKAAKKSLHARENTGPAKRGKEKKRSLCFVGIGLRRGSRRGRELRLLEKKKEKKIGLPVVQREKKKKWGPKTENRRRPAKERKKIAHIVGAT